MLLDPRFVRPFVTCCSCDSETADALAVVRSFFNVDSTMTTHQLVEWIPCERCIFQQQRLEVTFFLHFPSSGLELPDRVDLSDGDAGVSTAENHPSSEAGASLRKPLQKVAAEQPTDALGSTMRTSADKGKGMVELEEVPERGYTMWELCEVED
ncbi:hypothetical protein BHE74_00055985 [Ensete ventricosum]|uniref:Uncharacterized protein n=1 Tax=Ensete ventricosum TaxID=4639 RepID=A0A445MMT2_ENSVE|nr:hypothetical protein BHE74_00055985 [Ensete ventricosum]RZR75528.1 hypothetical protein BHM03_00060292 [Ensete ventricosum]